MLLGRWRFPPPRPFRGEGEAGKNMWGYPRKALEALVARFALRLRAGLLRSLLGSLLAAGAGRLWFWRSIAKPVWLTLGRAAVHVQWAVGLSARPSSITCGFIGIGID